MCIRISLKLLSRALTNALKHDHFLSTLEGDIKICSTQKIHVARGRSQRGHIFCGMNKIFMSPD